MRFHVLSLPHTQSTKDYIACAYTQKALNFCNMMTSLGHEVILYASEDNDANVTELVTIASKDDQLRWFGQHDYHKNFFNITWGPSDTHWVESNNNAIREIGKRIEKKDFICVIAGLCQKQIADAFPQHMTVEYGIGYTGVFAPFKVFESYAHMHWVYGAQHNDNGVFYDAVIPNYFDPADFTPSYEMGEYYLWMGRFISRKGPEIAVEATRRLGAPLIMAGQGVSNSLTVANPFTKNGETVLQGDGIQVRGDHITHIGHVGVSERAKLMAGAKATFMATTYLEPFGGVSIESMLSGTPVIATDFGAFVENVPHGIAGYRFRTVGEATQFASEESLRRLNRRAIRDYAERNFSLDAIAWRYEDYFNQLQGLWGKGFYSYDTTSPNRYERWLPYVGKLK